jgi:nucleotide-binding universal stress UspA family protein
MFTSLIVGVDGGAGDADAIALARQLADPGATLVLTGVVDSGPTGSRGANLDFDRVMRDDFAAVTRRLSDTLTGGSAQTEVIMAASVAHGLLEAAERRHADLIVVGSSRRGALGRVMAGDDARAMVRIADRPVAVAPADYAKHRGAIALIGAGYDGDDVAQNALETARQIAREAGARVRAVDVITAGHWPLDPIGMDVIPAMQNDRKLADEAMRRATETLDGVDGCVRVGICHDELTDFAHEVDLLVVGAHHRGRVGRWFFGSTSEALTHDLACPLLVIPAHAAPVTAATSHKSDVMASQPSVVPTDAIEALSPIRDAQAVRRVNL